MLLGAAGAANIKLVFFAQAIALVSLKLSLQLQPFIKGVENTNKLVIAKSFLKRAPPFILKYGCNVTRSIPRPPFY